MVRIATNTTQMQLAKSVGSFIVFAVILVGTYAASAAPYNPTHDYTYTQPDGSTFLVRLVGDEFFAYEKAADGRTIILDPTTGFYCYARLNGAGDALESTGVPVVTKGQSQNAGAKSLATLNVSDDVSLPPDAVLARVREAQAKAQVDAKGRPLGFNGRPQSVSAMKSAPSVGTTGSYVGLCVLIDFSDASGTIPQSTMNNLFNQASGFSSYGNACSVNEYYRIQSGGLLDYTNSVTSYVRVSKPKSYYDDNKPIGSKAVELVSEALGILVKQGFDFSAVSRDDSGNILCLNIFYAGTCASGWSTGLWPHSWAIPRMTVDAARGIYAYRYQMSDITTSPYIGTVCHENGHMLCGYPDLYAYDSNSSNLGYYSLMSYGCWGDGGRHPNNIDPYLKIASGWASVTDVAPGARVNATLNATTNSFYRYRNPAAITEYFIAEVRGPYGYEAAYGAANPVYPTNGVVLYHANENGSNTYSSITNTASPSYSMPFELLVIEATPSSNGSRPWYVAPSPGTNDGFYSHATGGVDSISDTTLPELRFWASSGRTTLSQLVIDSISARAQSMTLCFRPGTADSDGDGMLDSWEKSWFGNLSHDGTADTDGDKVSDLEEFKAGTNPTSKADADGDGMPDDWETAYLGNTSHNGTQDTDGDGWTDVEEYRNGTDPAAPDPRQVFESGADAVTAAVFSSDGSEILAGTDDGYALLWNAANGQTVRTFAGRSEFVVSVAIDRAGARVAAAFAHGVVVWDASTGAEVRRIEGLTSSVRAMDLSPDGNELLLGTDDAQVTLWSVATGVKVLTCTGHAGSVRNVRFNSDATQLLSGSDDGTAKLWNVQTGALVRTFACGAAVISVGITSDGARVLTASQNQSATVWNAATGALIKSTVDTAGAFTSISFSSNGVNALSGYADGGAKFWNVSTGADYRSFSTHAGSVLCSAFSPDGSMAVTGSADATAKLWRLAFVDSDSDGMADTWEMAWFGNLSHNGTADGDADHLNDLYEYRHNLNPLRYSNVPPVIAEPSPQSIILTAGRTGSLTLNASDGNNDALIWSIATQATQGLAAICVGGTTTKKIIYTANANAGSADSFVVQVSDGHGGSDSVTVNLGITHPPQITVLGAPQWSFQFGSAGAGNGQFNAPYAVAIGTAGAVYVVDSQNARVQVFDASGVYTSSWGSQGSGNGRFLQPKGIAIGLNGNVYVADAGNNRIQVFSASGAYQTQWGGSGSAAGKFNAPCAVATDAAGNVYVADSGNNRIQKFDASGAFLAQFGGAGTGPGQFNAPQGVSVGLSGMIYVADTGNNRVQYFSNGGSYLGSWGASGSGNGQFNTPSGLCTDSLGDVYVADSNNNRIQKFFWNGVFQCAWGAGQLNKPMGVCIDSTYRAIVADTANNRVQVFSQTLSDAGNSVTVTMSEDSAPIPFDLRLYASATDGDTSLTWSIAQTPRHGVATLPSGVGTMKMVGYTPQANYNGTDAFMVRVTDTHGATDNLIVNVNIVAVNDAPVIAEADPYSLVLPMNSSRSFTLNASDVENSTLTWSLATPPSHSTLTVAGAGSSKAITYKPATNYCGPDLFVVKVADAEGAYDTITINVSVTNAAPVFTLGSACSASVGMNNPLTISLSATDAEKTTLTWSVSSAASHGTAVVSGTGNAKNLVYTPTTNYIGVDKFDVTVTDAGGASAAIRVTVTVTNTAPSITQGATYAASTTMNSKLSISLAATDLEKNTITWSISTPAAAGTAAASGTGNSKGVTYTPNQSFFGSDSFVVTVTDGVATSSIKVNVTVTNTAPSITQGNTYSISTGMNNKLSISLAATDLEKNTITWSIATPATNGTAAVSGTGGSKAVTYTPKTSFVGSDSFVVAVSDGAATSTIKVNVAVVNTPPVISQGASCSASTKMNNKVSITLAATDLEKNTITWSIATPATNGTAAISGTGASKAATYTPKTSFSGSDSFVVAASDGAATTTVTVSVSVTNSAPVISQGASCTASVGMNNTLSITLSATDPDGNVITWSVSSPAANGTAAISGTGASKAFTYTPKANYHGVDTFVIAASDGGAADTITVNVTVTNAAPVITQGNTYAVSVAKNGKASFTLAATDPENNNITWSISSPAANGAAATSGTGNSKAITYTPSKNFVGTDTFAVQTSDGAATDIIAIMVTVQ